MIKDFLLNTFLQNNSLNTLTEAISTVFDCPVIIVDKSFHIVSSFAASDYNDEDYRRAVSHSELPLFFCTAVSNGLENFESYDGEPVKISSEMRSCYVSRLKSAGIELGYIIYICDSPKKLNKSNCFLAESLAAKQLYSNRREGTSPKSTAEEIITDLLNGKFSDEEIFNLEISGTFLSHFHPTRYALIDFSYDSQDIARGEYLREKLARDFHASQPLFYNGKIIIFLHEDHDMNFLRQLADEYKLRAVVSGSLDTLYSMKKSFKAVSDTLDYIKSCGENTFLKSSNDYAFLMLLKATEKNTDFCNEKIKELYEYDIAQDSHLCETLYIYMVCCHSLQKTCEKLFTHRNTIQYRIKKIKEEFFIDPDDSKKCAEYLTSLCIALVKLKREPLFV